MPKVEPQAPSLPHSRSMPHSAIRDAQGTPPVRQSRRHSDRVRSPSDSSGSDSDQSTRKASGPQPFPVGSSFTSNIPRPVVPRVKKLSDPARLESPLAVRRKGAQQPPSAYSPFGAFSRPSPASRRRRGSADSSPGMETGNDLYPRSGSQQRQRTVSQESMRASSPLWSGSQSSHPASPLSPLFPQHPTSRVGLQAEVHDSADIDEADLSLQAEGTAAEDADAASIAEEEADRVEEDLTGLHPDDLLNPRLSRISVRVLRPRRRC